MKNNNRISVKAVCASITGALMERNEDNFCFNGIGMPEVHDDLEENLTAEVGGQWVAVFDGIGGLPRGEEASYLAAKTLLDEERPWTEQDEQNYETILLQMLKKINDNITSWRKDRKITKMGTTGRKQSTDCRSEIPVFTACMMENWNSCQQIILFAGPAI